jgi:O-antigen/teichoic acid export membrane protein
MNRGLRLDRLAKDTVLNLLRQGFAIVINTTISVLLARGLGVEDRGLFGLANTLPTLVVTFTNFGVAPATVYYVALGKYDRQKAIRANMALSFWLGLLGIVVGSFLGYFFQGSLFKGVSLVLLTISLIRVPALLFMNNLQAISQGMEDFKSYNAFLMIPQVITLALLAVLVWDMHFGVAGALWTYLVSTWASLLILILIVKHKLSQTDAWDTFKFSFWPDREYVRDLFAYGFKAHMGNIVAYLNYDADTFMVNIWAGASAVGIYGLSVGIAEKLWILSGAVSTVLFPRIASLESAKDKRDLLTPLVTRHVLLFTLLMSGALGLFSNWIISILYGQEFMESATALRWLLPGIIVVSINRLLANDISGRGYPLINLWQSLIAFGANMVANYFLIPRYGAAGAAMSSSISYSLLAVLKTITYTRLSGVAWYKVWLPIRDDINGWKILFNILVTKMREVVRQPS